MTKRQAAVRARKKETTRRIDAAIDQVLDGEWRTADELLGRAKKVDPGIGRELDAQRLGARLSGRTRRGEAEKRLHEDGYLYEWRKV